MTLMLKESNMYKEYGNYYVKTLVQISPIEYNRKYGVFMKRPEDLEHIHCDDEEANMILWVYDELIAHKIAELLYIDDFMQETENN